MFQEIDALFFSNENDRKVFLLAIWEQLTPNVMDKLIVYFDECFSLIFVKYTMKYFLFQLVFFHFIPFSSFLSRKNILPLIKNSLIGYNIQFI